MTDPEAVAEAERFILSVVAPGRKFRPRTVYNRSRNRPWPEYGIARSTFGIALWRLIGAGTLVLTRDWRLMRRARQAGTSSTEAA